VRTSEPSISCASGQLDADADLAQLVFELGAILVGANLISVLHDDQSVIERARTAVERRLGN
jgi:hypothetical protein